MIDDDYIATGLKILEAYANLAPTVRLVLDRAAPADREAC